MIVDLLKLMRPGHWVKNLAVVAGPMFALRADAESLRRTALVFAAFCLASSATYTFNDLLDRHADALHVTKKNRPIASGRVTPLAAVGLAILLLAGSVWVGVSTLPPRCALLVIAYLLMNLAYSLALKHRLILDVIMIAIGFVLRAAAGAAAIEVFVSPWLIVCTFTLCLFLGFGKRRCEIGMFDTLEEAGEHRATLRRYTPELLSHLISVSAGIAIMTFLLYTMDKDPQNAPPFNKHHLLYTIPLVVYGVFRYAMVIQTGTRHGPTDILLRDRPFLGAIFIWTVMVLAIMTEKHWVGRLGLDRLLESRISTGAVETG
ncbi:MAG: decaprenyl-phosphate phosphoribosyltransferase [Phycisphaerales bacterium]|nr:decaprenyl-phosphate phosphoribosyltransferase [Phycisphaerales bacterium]